MENTDEQHAEFTIASITLVNPFLKMSILQDCFGSLFLPAFFLIPFHFKWMFSYFLRSKSLSQHILFLHSSCGTPRTVGEDRINILKERKKQVSSLTNSKINTVYFQPFGLYPKYVQSARISKYCRCKLIVLIFAHNLYL